MNSLSLSLSLFLCVCVCVYFTMICWLTLRETKIRTDCEKPQISHPLTKKEHTETHRHTHREQTQEHAHTHTYKAYVHACSSSNVSLNTQMRRPQEKGTFYSWHWFPSGKYVGLCMSEEFSCKNTTELFGSVWLLLRFLKASLPSW